jgi:hypothetical protein
MGNKIKIREVILRNFPNSKARGKGKEVFSDFMFFRPVWFKICLLTSDY